MKNFLIKTLITSAAIILASYVLPGVSVDRFITAVLVALVVALLNFYIRPILIILTLPVTVITLGLFLFVINALIILLAGKIVAGFHVESIWWAMLFSVLLSILTYLLEVLIDPAYRKNGDKLD